MVASTEENNKRLTDEVGGLRKLILDHQEARDLAFTTTLQATTELHTTAGQVAQLQERNTQITEQLATANAAVTEGGAEPDGSVIPASAGS